MDKIRKQVKQLAKINPDTLDEIMWTIFSYDYLSVHDITLNKDNHTQASSWTKIPKIENEYFSIIPHKLNVFQSAISKIKSDYMWHCDVHYNKSIHEIVLWLAENNPHIQTSLQDALTAEFRKISASKRHDFIIPDRGNLYSDDTETTINPSVLCCVHTTRVAPKKKSDGRYHIDNYAVDVGNHPRSTVHTSLNFVVTGNSGGNWTNINKTILAPFQDLIALNGKPLEMSLIDTFWSTNPDNGLILPDNFRMVQGVENLNQLVVYAPKKTLYKTNNFTADEKRELESKYGTPDTTDTTEWYASHNKIDAVDGTLGLMGFPSFSHSNLSDSGSLWHQITNTAKKLKITPSPSQYAHALHPTMALEQCSYDYADLISALEDILIHNVPIKPINKNKIYIKGEYDTQSLQDIFNKLPELIQDIKNRDTNNYDDKVRATYTYWADKMIARIEKLQSLSGKYKSFDDMLQHKIATTNMMQTNTRHN